MTARQPLAGITVVAVEQAVAAPFCTSRLADAGAQVIKIERPEGDFARGYDTVAAGQSSYFVWLNRGKRSVVLDLASAEPAAIPAEARSCPQIPQRQDPNRRPSKRVRAVAARVRPAARTHQPASARRSLISPRERLPMRRYSKR